MTITINNLQVKIIKLKSGDFKAIILGRKGQSFIAKDINEIYRRMA